MNTLDPAPVYIPLNEVVQHMPLADRRSACAILDKAGVLHHANRRVRWVITERLAREMPELCRRILALRAQAQVARSCAELGDV